MISIAHTHQFATVRLPSRARERLTKVETRQPLSHSVRVCNHATDVLISEVAGRPAIGAMRSRGERDKNVEVAGAGDGRGGIEVKAASLALSLRGGEVEGEERCDVGLATILEYFAIDLVAADGTGPHIVFGGNAWPYGRILGIGGGKFWVFSSYRLGARRLGGTVFGLRAWSLRTTGRSSGRLGSAGRE